MKERIYVCHTFYHVYVTLLKELALPAEMHGQATLVLSRMSNNFGSLGERAKKTGFFEDVIEFDEKRDTEFPELMKLKEDKGSTFKNMLARIKYTKLYAKLEEPFIPVNFKEYKDIYIYCDSDPVGVYLNKKHIKYHAVEDGLNTVANIDQARYENRGNFKLKAFMSKKLNLIFVCNGYGKYCKDMEVNDISAIKYPCKYYVEVKRSDLTARLNEDDIDLLFRVFINDLDGLKKRIEEGKRFDRKILVLTEPLCTLDVRERIFKDIVEEYGKDAQIFFKVHPRDYLDYATLFPEIPVFEGAIPMEMLNFFPDVHFDRCIGVLTEMKAIAFADECVKLGPDFMDKYEDPKIHRQNEGI